MATDRKVYNWQKEGVKDAFDVLIEFERTHSEFEFRVIEDVVQTEEVSLKMARNRNVMKEIYKRYWEKRLD